MKESDIKIAAINTDNSRSKTGIRITHIDSGVYAQCCRFKQQYKNKFRAIELLEIAVARNELN